MTMINPSQMFDNVKIFIDNSIYYGTLIVSITGFIFYISGIKKGKQISIGSGIIYFVYEVLLYCKH